MLTGALRKMTVLQLLQTRSLSPHTILIDRRTGIYKSAEQWALMFLDYHNAPVLTNEDWYNLQVFNHSLNGKNYSTSYLPKYLWALIN